MVQEKNIFWLLCCTMILNIIMLKTGAMHFEPGGANIGENPNKTNHRRLLYILISLNVQNEYLMTIGLSVKRIDIIMMYYARVSYIIILYWTWFFPSVFRRVKPFWTLILEYSQHIMRVPPFSPPSQFVNIDIINTHTHIIFVQAAVNTGI